MGWFERALNGPLTIGVGGSFIGTIKRSSSSSSSIDLRNLATVAAAIANR